jgi:hypothetical protein
MMVRCKLLDTIMLPISPSVKSGPFLDVLQVRYEISLGRRVVQALVRNDFDCGDWLLFVVCFVSF